MLETSALHFLIATYLHSHSSIHFSTLKHVFRHPHQFHHCSPIKYILDPCLKPCAYRILRVFPGHKSCYYVHDYHDLTLDHYVSSHTSCRLNDTITMQQYSCPIKPSLLIKSQPISQCQSQCSIPHPQCVKPQHNISLTSSITPLSHYIKY